ncbi:MAG: hypothetical protein R3A80_06825 [Bdellovibrionota bacterium]
MTPELIQLKSNFVDVIDASASTEVLTLAGELSSRRYYRILVKKPSEDAQTPSYVLQAAESFNDPEQHPFLLAQQLFTEIGIRVPKFLASQDKKVGFLSKTAETFTYSIVKNLACTAKL